MSRITANGLSFAIDEAGQGDTVALLLHGFPEARQSWGGQLSALAALGWRVVAPDLRGYGETDRPAEKAAYGIEHLVEDVDALFDALGARHRILIGHDWGGVIAWQTALRGRLHLDGLVILNAPHPLVFDRELRRGWRQRLMSWYVLFFQLPWLPEKALTAGRGRAIKRALKGHSPDFPDDLLGLYRRNITAPGAATAMINYYRVNMTRLSAGLEGREPIAVPTLMIWGEDDQALGIALAEGNEAHVRDLTLKRLPGVSHWVQQDASDQVNALISAWARDKGLAEEGLAEG
jgi:pimeloyl-ACP methyl ester carboxylesterase